MKKIFIVVLPFLLFSCFWESDEVKQAKQELLWSGENIKSNETINNDIQNETILKEQNTSTQVTNEIKSYYNINFLTWDKFLDIEPISNIEKITDTLDIKWIVNNPDLDKIIVKFENRDSNFPIDNYTLQTFKKSDKTFLYRAYKKYQVLDNWLNKYTIEWYVWENLVSKLELEVFIANLENTQNLSQTWTEQFVPKTIWDEDNSVFLNLPIDENNYWNPLMTWESSFTYSNISSFEVMKKPEIWQLTCENFWDYLSENYTWYYWNTCRPIYEDSFSVNVLTLSWDKYKYEKHYIDRKYNFYGVVLLESWEWLTQSDLQLKNEEFKTKTFEITTKTDKLFKDLLK